MLTDNSRTCPFCGWLVLVRDGCFTVHWPDLGPDTEMWCRGSGVAVDDELRQQLES